MITTKQVNRALKAAGIDAEVVIGNGYVYFDGPAVEWAYTTSVAVYRLNRLSIEQWVDEAKRIASESADRHPGV